MKHSELSTTVHAPPGYKWDETWNIFVPIVEDGLQQIDLSENPDEFATFLAKRAEKVKAASGAEKADEVQDAPGRRLINQRTIESWVNLPFSGGDWDENADFVQEARKRAIESGKAYRVWYRVREYSDGTDRWNVIGIENPKYIYVHKYRSDLYKVVVMVGPPPDKKGTGAKTEKPDDERWLSNLARARTAIEEYALCNDWKYFVTLTIDGDKLSRSDLEAFRRKLTKMIRDLRHNDGTDIDYLFVPELHPVALKDGRTEWHLHGLMDLPERYLVPFENRRLYGENKDRFPPRYIRQKVLKKEPVYYWEQYAASIGHSVLEPVQNRDASARYMLKYVTKTQGQTAQYLEKGRNLYYHSTGLRKAEKVAPEVWQDLRRKSKTGYQRSSEHCLILWYQL